MFVLKIYMERRHYYYYINDDSNDSLSYTPLHLKVRLREHKNAVDNEKVHESSVAAHSTELNHTIDWEHAKLKKSIRKVSHLNAWESMFIATAEQPLMNDDDAPITSPLFLLTKRNIR